MTQLSEHFSLRELTFSDWAARKGLDNTPGEAARLQLGRLATLILEPLRIHINLPILINSGFRSGPVNAAIGGAPKSQHVEGRAADIRVPGMTPMAVCEIVRGLDLPFDELILEFGRWAHVSVALDAEHPPQRVMTAINNSGLKRYLTGLVAA